MAPGHAGLIAKEKRVPVSEFPMVSKIGLIAGFTVLLAVSAPVLAQTAPVAEEATEAAAGAAKKAATRAAGAAKKKAAKNATEIVLTNARQANVTGVSVTNAEGKAVAALKKPLAPGKKISLKLAKNAGCTVSVNASFSDDAEFDQTDVDLCADKNVRFTD